LQQWELLIYQPVFHSKYTKRFESADMRRWYVELVLHGKVDYNSWHAESNYFFYSEDDILEEHKLRGCYLKVFKEERDYERSAQGKTDRLRDDILNLEYDVKCYRQLYQVGWQNQQKAIVDYATECGKLTKKEINKKQLEIIKVMSGRA
jgi:hypothetical protein